MIEIRDNMHEDDSVEVLVMVGHTIGNLHRPIKLERRETKYTFQFKQIPNWRCSRRLFEPINEHLDIKKTTMVFEPEDGIEIHEHP